MPDGFVAKFFVDAKTHLPLMLTWMDKEPLRMTMGPGRRSAQPGRRQRAGGRAAGRDSPEDIAQMQQEMAERMKEAEANRRIVEYRMFYADYKAVNGVKLPTRIQRMMDGAADRGAGPREDQGQRKIDPKKFEPVNEGSGQVA